MPERKLRYLILLAPAALMPAGAGAHCSDQFAPVTSLSRPSDGVAVETVCWPVLQECSVDTFHRAELLAELAGKAGARKHAAFLYVDSVANRLGFDSVHYMGRLYYVDTVQVEEVWISVHSELKGALPVKRFRYLDRFIHVAGNPYATTYTALLDTPVLAFFDAFDTLSQLGIGPLDGCFFEPTAYVLRQGRIAKRSNDPSMRMPGIEVEAGDFFRSAGLVPVDLPPVRPRHVGIRRERGLPAFRAAGRTGRPCDLNGRRVPTVWR